mmetsp:Transcript_19526/g.54484  ORF Transcript_19526/g.54484 Transcript_19526/m.54484 type:complete len:302 (-) Transcript_19526:270-1175(-)
MCLWVEATRYAQVSMSLEGIICASDSAILSSNTSSQGPGSAGEGVTASSSEMTMTAPAAAGALKLSESVDSWAMAADSHSPPGSSSSKSCISTSSSACTSSSCCCNSSTVDRRSRRAGARASLMAPWDSRSRCVTHSSSPLPPIPPSPPPCMLPLCLLGGFSQDAEAAVAVTSSSSATAAFSNRASWDIGMRGAEATAAASNQSASGISCAFIPLASIFSINVTKLSVDHGNSDGCSPSGGCSPSSSVCSWGAAHTKTGRWWFEHEGAWYKTPHELPAAAHRWDLLHATCFLLHRAATGCW